VSAASELAVVVPIKSFGAAKARLAEHLGIDARAELARTCAARVLAAAAPHQVIVVCDDDEVAAWARAHGAAVVVAEQPGLNEAARAGRSAARAAGFTRVLTVHSDLPRAEPLGTLVDPLDIPQTAVVVPDRHDDGTNALIVPTHGDFAYCYGPGSFSAHQREARRRGLALRVVRRPDLALDLDTLDDLRAAGLDLA
jgi:2-phospho-L-lactate guanylyltransferase